MGRIFYILVIVLLLFANDVSAIPSEGDFFPPAHKSIWGIQLNTIFLRDFNKVEGQASTKQYFIKAS